MTEPEIHFDCSNCGFAGIGSVELAGQNTPCVNCGSACEIPFPGKDHATVRCLDCGTPHELDHDEECLGCGDTDYLHRFCLQHSTKVDDGACLECASDTSEATPKGTLYEYEYELLLDVLCCVMAADGRASAIEKQRIRTVMGKVQSTWSPTAVDEMIRRYIERVQKNGFGTVLKATLAGVDRLKKSGKGPVVLKCTEAIASADDEIHEREQKVCDRIRKAVT